MAKAGTIRASKPFELIQYLKKETDYLPWFAAINWIERYSNLFESTPAYGSYGKFMIDLITPLINKLGWVDSSNDLYNIRLDFLNQMSIYK